MQPQVLLQVIQPCRCDGIAIELLGISELTRKYFVMEVFIIVLTPSFVVTLT